jgi:hypothetical protein
MRQTVHGFRSVVGPDPDRKLFVVPDPTKNHFHGFIWVIFVLAPLYVHLDTDNSLYTLKTLERYPVSFAIPKC